MAYVKHEDLCGAFKGNCLRHPLFIDIFLFHIDHLQHSFHTLITCLSFLLRWHTPSYPRSHRHTTRGPHTRICKLCVWFVHSVRFIHPATVLSHVSDWLSFSSRSSTDRENTRSVSRVHLVPSRFCWSTRTRPVPLLLFCLSLLQMMSFKASQHRYLPLSRPPLPPRSTETSAFSMEISSIYVLICLL